MRQLWKEGHRICLHTYILPPLLGHFRRMIIGQWGWCRISKPSRSIKSHVFTRKHNAGSSTFHSCPFWQPSWPPRSAGLLQQGVPVMLSTRWASQSFYSSVDNEHKMYFLLPWKEIKLYCGSIGWDRCYRKEKTHSGTQGRSLDKKGIENVFKGVIKMVSQRSRLKKKNKDTTKQEIGKGWGKIKGW